MGGGLKDDRGVGKAAEAYMDRLRIVLGTVPDCDPWVVIEDAFEAGASWGGKRADAALSERLRVAENHCVRLADLLWEQWPLGRPDSERHTDICRGCRRERWVVRVSGHGAGCWVSAGLAPRAADAGQPAEMPPAAPQRDSGAVEGE
jgi:hypothetical protein